MKRFLLAALVLGFATPIAHAQAWPAKPVRIVNAFAPGGPSDLVTRAVGERLQTYWGQPVVVDARPGADGVIGMEHAAKSAPDGYTFITVPVGNAVILPNLRAKLAYDINKDFVPVTLMATVANVLVVSPTVAAGNIRELQALSRANPGKLSFASPGVGSSPHVAGEMGGQVTMMFSQMSSALPLVRQGKLKAIGVASPSRHPAAPELPTIAEQALPGFEATAWYALFAPAGTPAEIVSKLAADTTRALQTPEVRERLAALGADAVGGTPAEFAQRLRLENQRWGDAIRKAGIKAD